MSKISRIVGRRGLAIATTLLVLVMPRGARADILSLDDGLEHGAGFDIKYNGVGRCHTFIDRGTLHVETALVSMNCHGRGIFPPGKAVSADFTLFGQASLVNDWSVASASVVATEQGGSSSLSNVTSPPAGSTDPKVTFRLMAHHNETIRVTVKIDIVNTRQTVPMDVMPDCRAAQAPPTRNLVCTADQDCAPLQICSSVCGQRCMPKP